MLQHAITRCNTLQHAATRCNTLQHKKGGNGRVGEGTRSKQRIHCHTLHHTATHCNTHQVAESELAQGLKLLGKVDAFFYDSYDVKVPLEVSVCLLKSVTTPFLKRHGPFLKSRASSIHTYMYMYIYIYIYIHIYIHRFEYMYVHMCIPFLRLLSFQDSS